MTTSTKGYNSILAAGNGRDLRSSSDVALKTSLFESTNIDPSVIKTDSRFEGSVMAPSGVLVDQGLKIIHGSQARCRATYANMYATCPVDVYGRPFTVGADGTFEAGAVAGAVPGAFCSSTYAGGISPAAVGFDADGNATVTATVTTRPLLGFEVDGTMHETREHAFTFNRSQVAGDDFTVKAVYGTEFWADAVNGKETNSGFYPDDAKLYIGSALDLTEDGDTVVALPGEYKEEPPQVVGANTIGSRVVVPAHRTLRSRDGAETTFIVGAASPNPVRDYDLGPGAVRCVYLNNDTRIQGFTLTGGHTSAPETGTTPDGDDNTGGGVLASAANGSEVVDCVITGCASLRGGGARNVTLRRCRLVGNQAVWFGSAAAYCNLFRCFIDNNIGGQTYYLYQGRMEGCTVGANNMNGVSSTAHSGVYLQSKSSDYHIFNSIFAAGSVTAEGGTNIYDCAFAPGIAVSGTNEFANCVFGEVALNADGTPVVGHNVGIDRGNPAQMTDEDRGQDLNGTTRIWNNAIDMGAIEADWRAHYSKALCKRRLVVDDAPETAEEQPNGQIRLTDGALTATWNPIPGGSYGRILNYSVPGTGTLTVSVDGQVVDTITAGQTRSYAFDSGLEANSLSFSYAPGDGDTLGALIGSFKDNRGALLIVR